MQDSASANSALLTALRAELAKLTDAERAQGAAAYMKQALPFLGLPMSQTRSLARQCLKQHPLTSDKSWRASVESLFFNARYQEERYAALELAGIKRFDSYQKPALLSLYKRMIQTAAWWDLVDELSTLVGTLLLLHPSQVRPQLLGWSKHEDIWLRRASIICQRKHRQQTDLELLVACIEPSLDSSEFFLRKAIGWALREHSKTDPEVILAYVTAHRRQLSNLSKREALKHLRASKKLSPRKLQELLD